MVSDFSKPIATESFYPVTCSIKALQTTKDAESVPLLCNPNTLMCCECMERRRLIQGLPLLL